MQIRDVHIHLGTIHPMLAAAALAAAFTPGSPTGPETTASSDMIVPPPIGQYWNGQGGINAGLSRGINGQRDGWLIVPTDKCAIFEKRILGTYGTDVTGATSDIDGLANTISLAAAGSDLCKEIRALVIDGHDDFFLMSPSDARLCIANVPELFEKEWYLTSRQYSSNGAWSQYFSDGYQTSYSKKFEARARAVRRLIL